MYMARREIGGRIWVYEVADPSAIAGRAVIFRPKLGEHVAGRPSDLCMPGITAFHRSPELAKESLRRAEENPEIQVVLQAIIEQRTTTHDSQSDTH